MPKPLEISMVEVGLRAPTCMSNEPILERKKLRVILMEFICTFHEGEGSLLIIFTLWGQ